MDYPCWRSISAAALTRKPRSTTPKGRRKRMNKTVLYLRSSKDRHDVSIDAQRGELEKLAAERGLVVIGEFSDPVERADDGDRPGLRGLLHELKSRARKWNVIIMLDTSRLARQDQAFALLFDRECEKHGVKVIYKMLPEGYGVMDKFFMSTVRSFDMLHSLLSKQKGVAGLAENIKQGHRAGGRAPFGYRLVHEEKGVIREGLPVMRSRLELSEDAPRIAAYLRDRAAGVPRIRARQKAGIHELSDTTLIGIEWNAVTYAGSTVWNVHNEFKKDIGYVGGTKRKPRKDWLIKEGTHPALIT